MKYETYEISNQRYMSNKTQLDYFLFHWDIHLEKKESQCFCKLKTTLVKIENINFLEQGRQPQYIVFT